MSAKTLIILRHAKSSWNTPAADLERPLAERGIADATAAGAILAEYELDAVLCSTAMRARQTWEHATAGGASCDLVEYSEAIYHAWPDELLGELRELDEQVETALLIGHQPTLSDLIVELARPSKKVEAVQQRFPTCALAVLTHKGTWSSLARGNAALKRYEIPRG